MISLWRRTYGKSPLHLLGQLVALAIAVYAYLQVIDLASTDNLSLLIWFLGGALLHDLIFVPIYLILDLIVRLGIGDHPLRDIRLVNHIRFPVAISGVMLLTLFPLILSKGASNFSRNTSGAEPPDYLARWLLVTVAVFAISAVAYAVRQGLGSGPEEAESSEPAPA